MTSRLRLLLVDDEPLIRQRVLFMLGDRFSITEAATAAEARTAATDGHDAIFMDIMLPDGNGIELCREIKERDPHSTVVMTSSMETVEAWNKAFRAGADGYLEKRDLLSLDPRKIELMVCNLVERNRLRRQAEETNQRQAELLSVLSHDVRAPFQALLGTIDLLRRNHIPPDIASGVENLYHCAKDQLAFINSLLELLRLESGLVGFRRYPVDVNVPVSQSVQGLRVLASAKAIILETDLAAGLPKVEADIARIAQLVNNLLTNAIKFTPEGGRLKVATAEAERGGSSGVEITVSDTGTGIRPEERARVFQRFHRGRDRGTNGEKGTGLGLAICKEIVQQHGGTIECRAVRPHGAEFRAWFPVGATEGGPGICGSS
jgi:two-component system, sensor histidine kinase and response regulator